MSLASHARLLAICCRWMNSPILKHRLFFLVELKTDTKSMSMWEWWNDLNVIQLSTERCNRYRKKNLHIPFFHGALSWEYSFRWYLNKNTYVILPSFVSSLFHPIEHSGQTGATKPVISYNSLLIWPTNSVCTYRIYSYLWKGALKCTYWHGHFNITMVH